VRVLSLIAAGLLAGVVVAFAAGGKATAGDGVAHTCSATDKQFIREARLNMTAVGESGREFLMGEGRARVVIEDARRAEAIVQRLRPTDPSLDKARVLMGAMFREYGQAVRARTKNREAGPHIYRAYGLANFARDILVQAQPKLSDRGCDVAGLL
jgi:hypothetical protein